LKTKIAEIHFKDTKAKKYALKKVEGLEKYHPKIELITIRLTSEKNHRNNKHTAFCELEFILKGKNFVVRDSEREIYRAIDKACERAKRSLTKHKEKELSIKHKAAIKIKRGNN